MVNRIRRLLYAVLLGLSARIEASDPGRVLSADLRIEASPGAALDGLSSYRIQFVAADPRIGAPLQKAAEHLRKRTWTLSDSVLSLRGGVGFDVELTDTGNLHLSLFPDEDDPQRGRRWLLWTHPDGMRDRWWSLGGSVDIVRTQPQRAQALERLYTDRTLMLAPQLILDMDRLAGLAGSAQLTLQNANWRDAVTDRYTDTRVWQINVRWRF
ncbi:hypothetical protein SAMN04488120_11723 [Fontimonas thermophila]|uniref:Uncharacterized protein n=1 Tax=Fontimonas thermophila TaxID=1076937 RepID=A0A1I2KFF9_9GAMM|nr:hypothetical protein [Fontimonas thermophila]SFF65049.1 hypothetical protein SAMN04488120_11723 [Fontimonas thermophila]